MSLIAPRAATALLRAPCSPAPFSAAPRHQGSARPIRIQGAL